MELNEVKFTFLFYTPRRGASNLGIFIQKKSNLGIRHGPPFFHHMKHLFFYRFSDLHCICGIYTLNHGISFLI